MNTSRSKVIIFLIVIVLTLAASTSISFTIFKFRNIPFPWDPAGYAYEGLRIAQDVRSGDVISFLADTYRQAWWPFFHSWLLAPAFIVFGNSYVVARSVSLFCFFLFIPVIYLLGLEMSEKRGHWIGLITASLALTSRPFLVLSSMCMREIPGLLMTFITLLLYVKAIRRQEASLYLYASLFMAFTLFTKWHHGVFLISAISLTQLTSNRKILSRNNYYLFLPFLIIMIAWFIYPRHIVSFYRHSTFQPHFYKFLSLENWLYYPSSFLNVYHSSPVIAAIVAIGFLYSLRDIRDPKIRLFVIHIVTGIILLTVKLDNRHRYIVTILPSIWILGASQLVEIVHYIKDRMNNKRAKIALALTAMAGILVISLQSVFALYKSYPESLLKYNFYSDEKPNKAYEFISKNVSVHNQIAVFGSWDYYNSLKSSTIRWHIAIMRDNAADEKKKKKEEVRYYFRQFLRNRDAESYRNFINLLENKDIMVHEFHLLSFMKSLNPEAYQDYRRSRTINPFSDKIADVNSLDNHISCLITICNERESELNYFSDQFMSKQSEWTESVKERFPDLGITVAIYERKVATAEEVT